jgi:hypothetical protein
LITVAEHNEARDMWIKRAQIEHFSLEPRGLKTKTPIPRQSRILTLTPFLDENGLLRAGGRLSNAPVPYSTRHPIILPQKHDVTRLIITNFHESRYHEGNEPLISVTSMFVTNQSINQTLFIHGTISQRQKLKYLQDVIFQ